ncbi:capsular exopolysaccharide family protein [Synechococcus sp. PCC 7335]|uniref:GumC family protein n=1 Tax=Synechococcus sp. (strain ATCC 29403 / PCC 7335) TaxID=91464 RepID=UPI00017ED617|nr:polysaccharide biosynthesis tyrosine autokinase [Synechococcus sp. PCC 7335]EDX86125.1 capsular exopolysaccharide family protein [Synechococcus sp. PCC 7335]
MSSANPPVLRDIIQEPDQEGGLRLGRVVDVLKRHVFLITGITALATSAVVARALTETPLYRADFELLTPLVTLETQIISTISPDALSNQSESVGVGLLDDTKLKILTSPRVLVSAVEELEKTYPDISYDSLKNNLTITPNDNGKTLTVQYRSDDPYKVTTVLEVVLQTYLNYSLEDRQNDIYRGVDFVNDQLPAVRARVNELEAELEALRQNSNLIDPLAQGDQLSQQMAQFTSDHLNLQVEIAQTTELYNDLQQELSRIDNEYASTSALAQSARYQSLLDQLLVVDSELADNLTVYVEDSPEVEVIEERRANLEPLLEREGVRVQEQLASRIRELNARDQALRESIATLDEQIRNLSTVTRSYNSIQRDLEIAATNLNEFLTKRETLRIEAAQQQTPWEILTPPSAPQAFSQTGKSSLLVGPILGLLLGSGIALLVDRVKGKICTVRELKDLTNVPLLATIPYNHLLEGSKASILPRYEATRQPIYFNEGVQHLDRTTGPFLEAFKLLATNVCQGGSQDIAKSFSVSSAVPNEGKSTISFYLAHASASLGKRTLLVDADLRHPTLHRLCNLPNEKGLSDYIAGDALLDESFVNLAVDENLFFMSSGSIAVDPAKVLASKKIEEFFQQIYKTFDVIIFDTPPLLGFADSLMVAQITQGLLLTVRLGEIKSSQLQQALDRLYTARVPVMGIVANGSREDDDSLYAYQQYYKEALEEDSSAILTPAINLSNGAAGK